MFREYENLSSYVNRHLHFVVMVELFQHVCF